MPIETATYISDLVPSNPVNTDETGTAANHLRLIKQVLQNTFPSTGTSPYLLNNLIPLLMPIGAAIFWTQSEASIPSGFHLADGSTVARSDGSGNITLPDLRDQFIVGAGNSYTVGETGGSTTATASISIAGHALSVEELPSHIHGVYDTGHNHYLNDPQHNHTLGNYFTGGGITPGDYGGYVQSSYPDGTLSTELSGTGITLNSSTTGISIDPTGSGWAHTHGASASATENRPPFYALCIIVKV